MPTDTQQGQQTITGSDGKTYKFSKGITPQRIDKYFATKGITRKKEFNPGPDPSKVRESMTGAVKSTGLNAIDYASKSLPAAGGAGYGMAGSKMGPVAGSAFAGLGGMAGAAGNEIIQRLVFGRSADNTPTGSSGDTNYNTIKNIVSEGVKQAALEGAGRSVGEVFFRVLNKIPHATVQNGIKFLPSELNGGKITKYVEDLLTNLAPSAGTMAEFKKTSNASAIGAADKLAKGFSRFSGTTEEMGKLLQDTYRTLEMTDKKALAAQMKTLANPKDIYKTAEYAAYAKNFKIELARKIAKENKPELIGGYLRASSSNEETRNMMALLDERGPKVMNAVRTRLLRDVINESLTGSTDPILKGNLKADSAFSGNTFKKALDSIGEDKLKAIYGEERYKNIAAFSDLVKHFGSGGGSGAGKFLNLLFLLGPLRSGLTSATGRKLAAEGFVFNRAAKIMTSTDGVRMAENYIRATGIGSVKAISAARDELKVYIDHADAEYYQEQHDIEEQYYKDHPEEKKAMGK